MNRSQQNFTLVLFFKSLLKSTGYITGSPRMHYGWPFHMIGNDHSIAENSILGIENDRL